MSRRRIVLSSDVALFVETLQKHGVRFMMVGGQAVIYYGYPRLTGDVDFWFEQTEANVQNLWRALCDFWQGSVPGVSNVDELSEPEVILMFGRPPNRVDLIASMNGLEFTEAWGRRVMAEVQTDSGKLEVAVIALQDLITNKKVTGRHKDLDDVQHLEDVD